MSEIDLVLKALAASKAASLAAIHAVEAIEQMLQQKEVPMPDTTGSPECTHETASLINTSAGTFRVCHCGWQTQV